MRGAGGLLVIAVTSYVAGRRKGADQGSSRMLTRLFDAGLITGKRGTR